MGAGKCAILLSATMLFLTTTSLSAEEDVVDRFSFEGDLRLRYEAIDEDTVADRRRTRFRARFGFTAKLDDSVDVVLRLASGGDNPVSTNQTFGDGFSGKDISLDLAYVDWQINENLRLHAGKVKNPVLRVGRAPLIWDNDLHPEGVALQFQQGGFFAAAGAYLVEERSDGDDSFLFSAQAAYTWPVSNVLALTTGGGIFGYTNTRGNAAFFNGEAQGNTLNAAGHYAFSYENIELFAEIETQVGDWPLTLFVQSVQNTAVSEQDSAYALGVRIGSAKSVGAVEFGWTYQDIEADAVVGTFNDSDFGDGGTDSDGHLIRARYSVRSGILLAATLFINEVGRFQGSPHDYTRLQLDIAFKFQ